MERVMGIEPTLPAWKAGTLPLSYTRKIGTHSSRQAFVVNGRVSRMVADQLSS